MGVEVLGCNENGFSVNNLTCRCYDRTYVESTMCSLTFREVWGTSFWIAVIFNASLDAVALLKAVQFYRLSKETNRMYSRIFAAIIVWQIGSCHNSFTLYLL